MEEQLKARLIGAAVLVVLAVLLIPELLSGRKPAADAEKSADATRGTRTYTIDLGGAVAAGGRLEPAPRSVARQPLPGASSIPVGPTPESAAESSAEKPAVAPPKPATAPPKAAGGSGQWAVQVGAFGSAAAARKLIGELQRDGYTAYEAPLQRSGKTLHRVRVGPEADRSAADRLSARLKNRGLPATVVAND